MWYDFLKRDSFARACILVLVLLSTIVVYSNHNRIKNLESKSDFLFPYDAFGQVEVHILVDEGQPDEMDFTSAGSGAVVDVNGFAPTSLILTANHVCNPIPYTIIVRNEFTEINKSISVTDYYGYIREATIVYIDIDYDLCLLEVEGAWTLPLSVAKQPATIGEKVYNISAPAGFFEPGMVPLLEGYYSGDIGWTLDADSIYTIPTRRGSSGSPVMNSRGEVIGVIHSAIEGFAGAGIATTWHELDDFITDYYSLNP